MTHLHHSQFKMRGCEANILQALLQGKRRLFICTCVHFIIIIFTSGKQQMLVEEDSRLAAASVVGIGGPPSPPPPPTATVTTTTRLARLLSSYMDLF
jgi:hypothetical protein